MHERRPASIGKKAAYDMEGRMLSSFAWPHPECNHTEGMAVLGISPHSGQHCRPANSTCKSALFTN